jgi:hypothetical protein
MLFQQETLIIYDYFMKIKETNKKVNLIFFVIIQIVKIILHAYGLN